MVVPLPEGKAIGKPITKLCIIAAQNQRFASLRCPKTSSFPHHPLVVAVSKNSSSFISMCLRSVHFLHSFRFGGGSSYLTAIHPSLHCVQFISPTSAPHSIGGLVAPFHNPRSHSITLPGCNPHSKIHTQTASKAPFHSPTLFHFTPNPPMPFSNPFPMVYFSYCGESTPIIAFQAER